MIKIRLKLFATLRNDRFEEKNFEIDTGSDIEFLLRKFNLKNEDVPIVFINGRHADYKTLLNDGDDVAFFPPIGGG